VNESVTRIVMDDTDRRILQELQRDASLTNQELASRCATSAATCLRRVRRMVEGGIIERRVAILSPQVLGSVVTAIAEVTLDRQGAEHLRDFERRAVREAAVIQCYRVSPGPDFILVVLVDDMTRWAEFVERLFTQDANVRNVKSYFVVRRAKFETEVPLSGLPRDISRVARKC
jgi:DNA-binding Lrp family transcriptional regulator